MKLIIINSFIAAILSFGAFLFFAGDGALNIIKQITGKSSSVPVVVSAVAPLSTSSAAVGGQTSQQAEAQSVRAAASLPAKIDYSAEKASVLDRIKALAPLLKSKKEEYIKLQNANKDMNKTRRVGTEWVCVECGKNNPGVGSSGPSKCLFCSSRRLVPAALETEESREAKRQAVKSCHEELKSIEKQMAELQADFSEISKKEQAAKEAINHMGTAKSTQN